MTHSAINISYSSLDDIALLHGIGEGNMQCFRELYERYQPKLSHYLSAFCDIQEANDILQDVFVKVWIRRNLLTGITVPEIYLQRMVRNCWFDKQKAAKIRVRHEEGYGSNDILGAESITDHLTYKEYSEMANKAIQQLPARRKLIFEMSVFRGLSLSEIASETGLSKAVIKKQLSLANRFLRDYLSKQGDISLLMILVLLQAAK